MRSLNQPAGLTTHEHRVNRCPNWREAEAVLGGTASHEIAPRERDAEPVSLEEVLGETLETGQTQLEAFA